PLLNSCSLFTLIPRPSTSPLFPYTTLFRSYAPLGILLDATEIGMAGTSGSYVNTMVIKDKTGDPEIDAGRWKTAMEMTTGIYNLIFDEDNGMNSVELDIFSFLLTKLYARAGVNENNPDAWYERSKDLTFYTLYAMLDDL